ncbi:MAG: 2,3-bisphosphoglycerate-independent phosphoglycerate mutase, partial [Rhodospirillaceae bacterium]|nr:2,3-bisphosphoglycerate-independent phosphoglycerate mutase [Rhodospirillaceae bacterium]
MTRTTNRPKPVVLCILDGWGHRVETNNNAIALGNTPNWDRLVETVPKSLLQASSADVGLPDGQMGNSEVGHTNLGAGRVVLQNLPRINAALAAGTLAGRPAMTGLIEKLKAT